MKLLTQILTMTILMLGITEFAEARAFGPPPGYTSLAPIAGGCRIAVDKVVRGNFLVAGATSLNQSECSAVNKPSPYAGDPYSGADVSGNLSIARMQLMDLGLNAASADEVVALAKRSNDAALASGTTDGFTIGDAVNYRVHGDWFGASAPPPVMCGAINTSFGDGCVFQTSSSVKPGTTQVLQNVTAGYTGSLTAVCTSSGQYELSNLSCTANPPPPPPTYTAPAIDYSYWDFGSFNWNFWYF